MNYHEFKTEGLFEPVKAGDSPEVAAIRRIVSSNQTIKDLREIFDWKVTWGQLADVLYGRSQAGALGRRALEFTKDARQAQQKREEAQQKREEALTTRLQKIRDAYDAVADSYKDGVTIPGQMSDEVARIIYRKWPFVAVEHTQVFSEWKRADYWKLRLQVTRDEAVLQEINDFVPATEILDWIISVGAMAHKLGEAEKRVKDLEQQLQSAQPMHPYWPVFNRRF